MGCCCKRCCTNAVVRTLLFAVFADMKLKSLIQHHSRLEVAEVEIQLIPGVPQIHFLGLPDRQIKESFYRIKSALKSSGYRFPLTHQMIVNIKPNHLRKSSRGVELAVAVGLLLMTQQIAPELIDDSWIIYGELGLDGSIYEPTDLLDQKNTFKDLKILTGLSAENGKVSSAFYRLKHLQDPCVEVGGLAQEDLFERPVGGLEKLFTQEESEFLFLAGVTNLHALLAGAAGVGKTTLAKSFLSFMKTPQQQESGRWVQNWRSCVAPHSSVTPSAFLGGGVQLYEGEVERVQSGLLVMDEFLEFDAEILESLRGPMTGETLRLARGGEFREVKPNFQVMATTNLCPCGKWTPLNNFISCRFSRTRCVKYLEKLSGPLLDRFGLLFFLEQKKIRLHKGWQILKRIENVRSVLDQVFFTEEDDMIQQYYQNHSTRRRQYLKKVAQVYAIERELVATNISRHGTESGQNSVSITTPSTEIRLLLKDYSKAEKWVIEPFVDLERGMG